MAQGNDGRSDREGKDERIPEGSGTEWERDEQGRLPTRGTGSQDNQGRDHRFGPEAEAPESAQPLPTVGERDEDLHSGGTRGGSNEGRSSDAPSRGGRGGGRGNG